MKENKMTAIQKSFVALATEKHGENAILSRKEMNDSLIAILNWNVHKETDFPLLQKELITFMKKSNPNFLTLQEFSLTDTIENKLKNIKKIGWEFAPNIYSSKNEAYSGLATLSETKPYYTKSFLSNGKEPFLGSKKNFSSHQI